ncbi:MAG: tetratricopeptide repeat protein [bacterium]|nr:MAG: tetratricopeptide repeat protein [bacterium]
MAEVKGGLEKGQRGEIQQAEHLIETAPESSYGRFLAGSIYLRNGEIDSARDQFIRSAELDPSMGAAFSALGDISAKSGDLDEAEQFYLKAHTIGKTPVTANRLALLRIQGGHLDSAREVLSRTLEEYPDDVMTRNNLALALDMMGKTSEGIRILDTREVKDPHLLRTRALLQLKEGRPDRAAADLQSVLDETSSPEEWLLMGTADLQRGNLAQAEDKFRSAVAAGTSTHEGYLNLGLTLRRQGRFAEAEKVYMEGIARAPHPDLHLNLGVLYELYRGNQAQALEQYRKYLLLGGPASDRVKEWVEYLEGVVENRGGK